MTTRFAPNIRNAAIGTLVAAGLVAGVLVFGPGTGAPPPASGPAARAMLAADEGAPASLGDLSALISDRERWVRSRPGDEVAWAVLGSAYVERAEMLGRWEDYPKAQQALERSLEVLPARNGNADAELGMAALANARRDYPSAQRWAEGVRARMPKRWAVYPQLIDAYSGLGDYAAVAKAVAQLEKLRPGTAPTLTRSAQSYRDHGGREDAAAKAYEAMTRVGGKAERSTALHRLGELSWEQGELGDAVGYYNSALRADPENHAALAGRARALAGLGRSDEALQDYERALRAAPLPEYALEAGELYDALGLGGDARTAYALLRTRAALAREYGVNEELVLGRYEADHGDAASAARRLKAEWDRGARNAFVADALGWALHRAGRGQEGLEYAKRARAIGIRSALFSYHQGEIERSLGESGPARRHLAEALRINPYFSPLLAGRAETALAELGEAPMDNPPDDITGRYEGGEGEGGEEADGRDEERYAQSERQEQREGNAPADRGGEQDRGRGTSQRSPAAPGTHPPVTGESTSPARGRQATPAVTSSPSPQTSVPAAAASGPAAPPPPAQAPSQPLPPSRPVAAPRPPAAGAAEAAGSPLPQLPPAQPVPRPAPAGTDAPR
ncbi:tetratricopeptide repeat protein [Streptomyces sp. SCSIO 30461]|uniref:tetratricopeptide repeat protein n=1 Tax=Streptomyces sp. SCSIO 30461 TaxID=3118085 RepID=UPI0030D5701B